MNEDKRYTVWVGDVEVNDYLMTFEKAQLLADVYIDDGYDDVQVEEVQHESIFRCTRQS